jgi:putative transposase
VTIWFDWDKQPNWRVEDAEYHIRREDDNETLLLTDRRTLKPRLMLERAFLELYAQGRAVELRKRSATPPLDLDDPRMKKARMRLFYARAFDKRPVARSKTALAGFIKGLRPNAILKGHAEITVTQLNRVLDGRGVPGDRALSQMLDRHGTKTPKSRFSDAVENAIAGAIDHFYSSPAIQMQDAYLMFSSLLPAKQPSDVLPCRETIRLRIKAAENYANVARRYGELVAVARFRGVGKRDHATRPLECVLVDATEVDVVVVDDETGAVLGSPTLYAAIDVATRSIVGWHLGFGGETVAALHRLFLDVLSPKVGLKERYQLKHDHDPFGLGEQFVLDNALAHVGKATLDGWTDLGADLEFAPIREPRYKPFVERWFHTMNTKLFHKLKGSKRLSGEKAEALGLRPGISAAVTLHELLELVASVIVDDYQRVVHDTLGMSPARAWQEGVKRHKRRVVEDLRQAAADLGTVEDALLTREGIRYRRHRFHDQATTTSLLLDLVPRRKGGPGRLGSRSSGTVKVKIKVDVEDASRIQVWNGKRRCYETLPNVNARFAKDISFPTAAIVFRYHEKMNAEFESEDSLIASLDAVRRKIAEFAPQLSRKRLLKARAIQRPGNPLTDRLVNMVEVDDGSLIPVGIAAVHRTDGDLAEPAARRGGKAASRKAAKAAADRRAGRVKPDQAFDDLLASAPPSAPVKATPATAVAERRAPPSTPLPDHRSRSVEDLLSDEDWN